MPRYEMTIVFDIHDDEDVDARRLKIMRLQHDVECAGRTLRQRLRSPTEKELALKALQRNPFLEDFHSDVAKHLQTDHQQIRTTYEIVSFEELPEL